MRIFNLPDSNNESVAANPQSTALPDSLSGNSSADESKSPSCDDTSLLANGLSGHVDNIGVNRINGWASDTRQLGNRVFISLRVNDSLVAMTQAVSHRPDVREAGFGDGYSGFEFDLTSAELNNFLKADSQIELWVNSADKHGLLFKGHLPDEFEQLNPACKELATFAYLDFMLKNPTSRGAENSLQYRRTKDAEDPLIEQLFSAPNQAINVTSIKDVPSLSAYTRFTRDRLNQHKVFDYDNDPRTAVDLLIWYLEAYGTSRAPFRVPLSRDEIAFCNEMIIIPGTQFSLTRLHYYFFLRNRPNDNLIALLNNESTYCSEVIEWVTGTCRKLNIEDVCSPIQYLDFLRTINWEWKGRKFPLNRYFNDLFHKKEEWKCFDLSNEDHRGALYLLALIDGIENFKHVHLMPDDVKNLLISDSDFLRRFRKFVLTPHLSQDIDTNQFEAKLENAYIERGYALASNQYTSISSTGHRYAFANLKPKSSVDEPYDIQLIGPLNKASGLGQATRLSANIIKKLGLKYNFVNFDLDNPAPEGFSSKIKTGEIGNAKINLIHLNAESVPFAFAYTPDVYSASYNIGYFFWELNSPALCHHLALDILDEVWVCSEYGVSQYSDSTLKPVINVGMCFEEKIAPNKLAAKDYLKSEFGISTSTRVFLATFDSFSFIQRKNPLGVVQAFKKAFSNDENVCLLLKTQNKTFVGDPAQLKLWKAIEYTIADDSRIRLINRTFVYDELLTFKKAADCYISLHKSEGWGFGMIEAMALEIPVVATNYSGNLEYCSNDNSWLVDAKEQYVSECDYIFVVPGQKWVEPDINNAADLLYRVYVEPEKALEKAALAKERITSAFSESAISKRYSTRIEHLLKSTHTPVL